MTDPRAELDSLSDRPTAAPDPQPDRTPVLRAGGLAPEHFAAESLPGFTVLGVLGRGGMGVVFKARQDRLNRTVAVKMLRDPDGGPEIAARFLAEAEAIASLQHPHIVQVFESGTDSRRRPYYVLEYCPGGSLAERLRTGPLPPREAAAMIRQLALGVQAAHDRGILHRDLKPANVLFAADGTAKLGDFGLAKWWADADTPDRPKLTRTGAILGTPGYMAPEQAEPRASVGPAADVHGLGVILYECLTGRPPYLGDETLDVLVQVRASDPLPPTRLRPGLPRDLETVTLKCLEKSPHRRYARAADLADDLQRFLAGEAVVAKPAGPLERAWKWAGRRPTQAALAAVSGVAVLAIFALAVMFAAWWRDGERLRAELTRQRDFARVQQRRARQALDALLSDAARSQLASQARLSAGQKKMLADAVTYYREFAAEVAHDDAERELLADARQRLAWLLQRLGQPAEAEVAAREALAARLALAESAPDDLNRQRRAAESHADLADALIAGGRAAEAVRQLRAAIAVLDIVIERTRDPADRYARASHFNRLTFPLQSCGTPAEVDAAFRSAVAELSALVTADANDRPAAGQLAATLSNLSQYLREQRKLTEAEAVLRQALATAEADVAARPDDLPRVHHLNEIRVNLCGVLGDQGRRADEVEALASAGVESQRRLVRQLPGVPEYRRVMCHLLTAVADVRVAGGDRSSGEELFREAIGQREELLAQFPGVVQYAVDLGGAYTNFGNTHFRRKEWVPALEWYEKAAPLLERVVASRPDHVTARSYLTFTHYNRAISLSNSGQNVEALVAVYRAERFADGRLAGEIERLKAQCRQRLTAGNGR